MFVMLLFSQLIQAGESGQDCIERALDAVIAHKVSNMSDGDCSQLNQDSFIELGEGLNDRKRFVIAAKKQIAAGGSVPSDLFSSFEDNTPVRDLYEKDMCDFIKPRTKKIIQQRILKECPEAAEEFEQLLGTEKFSDEPLSNICNKMEEIKQKACAIKASKLEVPKGAEDKKFAPARINTSINGARASHQ